MTCSPQKARARTALEVVSQAWKTLHSAKGARTHRFSGCLVVVENTESILHPRGLCGGLRLVGNITQDGAKLRRIIGDRQ